MSDLRRKRVWDVGDFARHTGLTHRRARRLLKRLDEKHKGGLLIPTAGTNREYTFFPAVLSRLEPDLFTPVQSLEFRMDGVEERIDEMRSDQRRIVAQVGSNTRDINRLKSRSRAA